MAWREVALGVSVWVLAVVLLIRYPRRVYRWRNAVGGFPEGEHGEAVERRYRNLGLFVAALGVLTGAYVLWVGA